MYIVILVTAANKKEARRIAGVLVKNRLAACVNIISGVDSIFRWLGKVDKARELLLIIKSKKEKLNAVIKCVKALHSYEVPEIIALAVAGGNKDYLNWIDESLTFNRFRAGD